MRGLHRRHRHRQPAALRQDRDADGGPGQRTRAADVRADTAKTRAELADIETKLAGMDFTEILKKADPATEALAKFLGWMKRPCGRGWRS